MTTPERAGSGSLPSLLDVVRDLFGGRERWYLAGAFGVSLVAAAFETVGVASILPFMALVLDPTAIQRYHALSWASEMLGVTSSRGALLLLGTMTISLVALGNAASALNLFVQGRFAARAQTRISSTLLKGYLSQPYAFHVSRDAPSLIKVLMIDVGSAIGGIITPFMLGVSRMLTACGVLIVLVTREATISVFVVGILGVLYLPVYLLLRARQRVRGVEFNALLLERQRVVHETLGGMKELQVLGREHYAAERFEGLARATANAQASNAAASQLPRYLLETIAFGGILVVTMGFVASGTKAAKELVPLLALYAFAAYRIMPALQQAFAAALEIRFRIPSLLNLYSDYLLGVDALRTWSPTPVTAEAHVPFDQGVTFRRVSLTYAGATAPAVRDVNLVFRAHESVGLIGPTGAGKTSLAELVMGVHVPSCGTIAVDEVPLTGSTIAAWRRQVGYVPQRVFLSNASVAENIAFGLRPSDIDRDAVERAAALAQAAGFIAELPKGYETKVGERGVKLSGGQAQRIGIARALYNNPRVLVFDEATSALDGRTEQALMEALRAQGGARTLVLIAHRLRSVEMCDRIVMMQDGTVVADGPYQTLLKTSPTFRHFVGRPEFAPAAATA